MAQSLRPYQVRATDRVREFWRAGTRRVCLVAPTGSGKTTMGAALLPSPDQPAVWVAHRRDLVQQAADRIARDGRRVGCVCPGLPADLEAPVQVGTIQTLLARDARPPADVVVLDECPHYAPGSEDWTRFADAYPAARVLGLTATPERSDGSPLGDVFDDLVVAATYSELIASGHITPCHVFAPPRDTVVGGWAADPVLAYKAHAAGTTAFAFFGRVALAEEWTRNFLLAGVRARTLSAKTPTSERTDILEALRAGSVDVVCNVDVLTEGIDVPRAATCILARKPAHASTYMQMVGRVLRPFPGKTHAVLLDLVDATSEHGLPTDDRRYSLTGELGQAIVTSERLGHRQCPRCGRLFVYAAHACPGCGWLVPETPPPTVRIWNVALRRVYAGADTPPEHKAAELARLREVSLARGFGLRWVAAEYEKLFGATPSFDPAHDGAFEYRRLRRVAVERGFSLGWVVSEYTKTLGTPPPLDDVTDDERATELARLQRLAAARGYKPGWAAVNYRAEFGCWPSRRAS